MNAIPHSLQVHAPDEVAADPSMEEILASIRRIIADDQNAAAPAPAASARSTPTLRATLQPRPARDDDERAPAYAAHDEEPRRAQRPPAPQPMRERPAAPQPRPSIEAQRPALERRPEPPRWPEPSYEPRRQPDARLAEPRAVEPRVMEPRVMEPRAVQPPARPEPHRPVEPQRRQEIEPVRDMASMRAPETENALLSANADASVASSFQALAQTMLVQNHDMMSDAVREMMRPMLKQWLDDNLPVLVERLVRAEIERVARGGR